LTTSVHDVRAALIPPTNIATNPTWKESEKMDMGTMGIPTREAII